MIQSPNQWKFGLCLDHYEYHLWYAVVYCQFIESLELKASERGLKLENLELPIAWADSDHEWVPVMVLLKLIDLLALPFQNVATA